MTSAIDCVQEYSQWDTGYFLTFSAMLAFAAIAIWKWTDNIELKDRLRDLEWTHGLTRKS